MKARVLVLSDVEGVIGVYNMDDPQSYKRLACYEMCIVIKAIRDAFEDIDIHICDCHNDGHNLDNLIEAFPDVHFYHAIWDIDFSKSYQYALMIGFHAMNQAVGYYAHSFRPDFYSAFLGDSMVGEVGIFANLLSYYSIPLVYASCDKAAEKEVPDKCVIYATKNILNPHQNDNTKEAYKNLYVSILNALQLVKKRNYSQSYDNRCIRIKLTNRDLLLLCQFHGYIVEESEAILFNDTITFICMLHELCLFLEEANKIINKLNNTMIVKIKRELSKQQLLVVTDQKVQTILNTDICRISAIDRANLDIYIEYVMYKDMI